MHWEIEFYREGEQLPIFIEQLFEFLISKGVEYNAGKYQGRYTMIGGKSDHDVDHFEEDDSKGTDEIASILEEYREHDLTETSLTVHLYHQQNNNFHFSVRVVPIEPDKTLVSFETHTNEIPDSDTFLEFVHLCKDVFSHFDFTYGSYRSEHMSSLLSDLETFIDEPVQVVNFYSRELTDNIGRDLLLSAPAYEVEELENGGVYLLVCPEQLGCYDELRAVRNHLNQT